MNQASALSIAATPRPTEGVISWNVNTACNYRCSYCTQRFKEDRGRWARDLPLFLAAFARLPGQFEIKLSGGEPFVHPNLEELTAGLAALGHRVSVVTNFSASDAKLQRFVAAARGRIGVFSASLHLEYVDDVPAFVDKARALRMHMLEAADPALPAPTFVATVVATRAILPHIARLQEQFGDVALKVQPEKQDRDVIHYSGAEQTQLLQLGGHNRTGSIVHSFEGLPCWAGTRYFILDDVGQAYRCYPARRYKREHLGNFLDPQFTLGDAASPCLYATCNCTVPIARRMMPTTNVAASSLAPPELRTRALNITETTYSEFTEAE
jgi:organic radical activating enzyme